MRQILYDLTYMWNLLIRTRKSSAITEDRLVVARGKEVRVAKIGKGGQKVK